MEPGAEEFPATSAEATQHSVELGPKDGGIGDGRQVRHSSLSVPLRDSIDAEPPSRETGDSWSPTVSVGDKTAGRSSKTRRTVGGPAWSTPVVGASARGLAHTSAWRSACRLGGLTADRQQADLVLRQAGRRSHPEPWPFPTRSTWTPRRDTRNGRRIVRTRA